MEGGYCPLFGGAEEEEPAFEKEFRNKRKELKSEKEQCWIFLKHTVTKAEEQIQGDIEEVGTLTLKRPHSP